MNHLIQTQGKRFEWKIQKRATELADAARTKQLFHWERKKWWEESLARTMKEAREHGLEIVESDATLYNSTKGFGPRLGINEAYQIKANEAHQKTVTHENLRSEYQVWVDMLQGAGEQVFELDVKDYQYFFGSHKQEVDEHAQT